MADLTKPWNTKHYILAALGGTLAAALVVTVVSAILRPAHITFSVVRASRSAINSSDGNGLYLHVTIAANTTSRRAKVKYQSVFVDVQNATNPAVTQAIIHLKNDTVLPDGYLDDRRPRTIVNASVLLVEGNWVQTFAGQDRISSGGLVLAVVVTAQVRFKIGVAHTRLFDVKVYCPHVDFIGDAANATGTNTAVPCM